MRKDRTDRTSVATSRQPVAEATHGDALPSYQDSSADISLAHGDDENDQALLSPEDAVTDDETPQRPGALGPTISAPFAFPSTKDAPPPPNYAQDASHGETLPSVSSSTPATYSPRPIAIPQTHSSPTAPFLPAYPPILLNAGVPSESWLSFVDTLSAFLTARVSQRAISHANKIGNSVGRLGTDLGKSLVRDAKQHATEIAGRARRGNVLGAAVGVVGGTIGLTLSTAFRTVSSVLILPGTAIASAAALDTPKGRADAYCAAANAEWFGPRGLMASLVSTEELAARVSVSTEAFIAASHITSPSLDPDVVTTTVADNVVSKQLGQLADLIEPLQLRISAGESSAQQQQQGSVSQTSLESGSAIASGSGSGSSQALSPTPSNRLRKEAPPSLLENEKKSSDSTTTNKLWKDGSVFRSSKSAGKVAEGKHAEAKQSTVSIPRSLDITATTLWLVVDR